jgi:hypothetical protein
MHHHSHMQMAQSLSPCLHCDSMARESSISDYYSTYLQLGKGKAPCAPGTAELQSKHFLQIRVCEGLQRGQIFTVMGWKLGIFVVAESVPVR